MVSVSTSAISSESSVGLYSVFTSNDLISYYNFPYYEKCSKLCIGTLALMAKVESGLPVELTSFTGSWDGTNVNLNWETATELNNYGFEIQKKSEFTNWYTIGFVEGSGTKQSPSSYSYNDSKINEAGKYLYRLKQIDNNGSFNYSQTVEMNLNPANGFVLEQNYPNPFNPSTRIRFSIPKSSLVKLSVYNVIGEEIRVLADGFFDAGYHEINFNSQDLSSGVYLYRLQYEGLIQMKKMLLLE